MTQWSPSGNSLSVLSRLRAPASRMGPADDVEGTAKASPLFAKYGTRVDSQSAREMLAGRMEKAEDRPAKQKKREKPPPAPEGGLDQLGDYLGSREGKAMQKKVMRGVFGMLKKRL